jgi:hypothetical protein
MNETDEQETCLLCGGSGRLRRGLCSSHYQAFLREWRQIPEANRDAFEQELIAAGMLLPRKSPGYRAKPSQFSVIAEKYKPYDA